MIQLRIIPREERVHHILRSKLLFVDAGRHIAEVFTSVRCENLFASCNILGSSNVNKIGICHRRPGSMRTWANVSALVINFRFLRDLEVEEVVNGESGMFVVSIVRARLSLVSCCDLATIINQPCCTHPGCNNVHVRRLRFAPRNGCMSILQSTGRRFLHGVLVQDLVGVHAELLNGGSRDPCTVFSVLRYGIIHFVVDHTSTVPSDELVLL